MPFARITRVLMFAAAVTACQAQGPAPRLAISGQVTDSAGEPLYVARLHLMRSDFALPAPLPPGYNLADSMRLNTIADTIADRSGHFTLPWPGGERYRLQVESVAYVTVVRVVTRDQIAHPLHITMSGVLVPICVLSGLCSEHLVPRD